MAATNSVLPEPLFSIWVDDGDEWMASMSAPESVLRAVESALDAAGYPLKKTFEPKGTRYGCKFKKFPTKRGVWAGPLAVMLTAVLHQGFMLVGSGHHRAQPQFHFMPHTEFATPGEGVDATDAIADAADGEAPPAYDEATSDAPAGEEEKKKKGGKLAGLRKKAAEAAGGATTAVQVSLAGAVGTVAALGQVQVHGPPETPQPAPPPDTTYHVISAQHETIMASGGIGEAALAALSEALTAEGFPLTDPFASKDGRVFTAKVNKVWSFEKKASATDAVTALANAISATGLVIEALAYEYVFVVREREPAVDGPDSPRFCALSVSGKKVMFMSANLPFEASEMMRGTLSTNHEWAQVPTGGSQVEIPESFATFEAETQGLTVTSLLTCRVMRSFVGCKVLVGGDDNYMLFLAAMDGSNVPMSDARIAVNMCRHAIRLSPCNDFVQTAVAEALLAEGHELQPGYETQYGTVRLRDAYTKTFDKTVIFIKATPSKNKYKLIEAQRIVFRTLHSLGYLIEHIHHGKHRTVEISRGTDGKSRVVKHTYHESMAIMRQTPGAIEPVLTPAAERGILTPPKPETALPEGWEKKTNPVSGQVFYQHTATGTVSNTFPEADTEG